VSLVFPMFVHPARFGIFFYVFLVLCLYFIRTRFFFFNVLHFAFCLYLQHTTQTSMPPAGFEPPTPASAQPLGSTINCVNAYPDVLGVLDPKNINSELTRIGGNYLESGMTSYSGILSLQLSVHIQSSMLWCLRAELCLQVQNSP
jgi:hypothetical protein